MRLIKKGIYMEIDFKETPELEQNLHWHNSSNVLCNYMREPEYLIKILKNQAIIPRYVIEPLDYLKIDGLKRIAFPMTCFCDIPFSKVGNHMSNYGQYGIALDKKKVIRNNKIQPIHYMNPASPLVADFKEAFNANYNVGKKAHKEDEVLLNYLLSTLLYMKPISGLVEKDGEYKMYIFQDECEWRYIPDCKSILSIPLIINDNKITEKRKNTYSDVLEKHPETWVKFDWNDLIYIVVPDEVALQTIIDAIMELPLDNVKKHLLISKIQISNRFTEDLV